MANINLEISKEENGKVYKILTKERLPRVHR